jgi:hypothetical protein
MGLVKVKAIADFGAYRATDQYRTEVQNAMRSSARVGALALKPFLLPAHQPYASEAACGAVQLRNASWEWLNDEVAKTRRVTDRAREVNRKGPRLSLNPQQLR